MLHQPRHEVPEGADEFDDDDRAKNGNEQKFYHRRPPSDRPAEARHTNVARVMAAVMAEIKSKAVN